MKRILVVDDNRLIVNLLRVNLMSAGYEVLTATDGFQGLATAVAERPDLIILDVMMPEMDGFEVARQVRNNTLIAHVPIIMLTARGTSDSIVAGLDAGADDYMAKPFEISEVLARVKAHLRRSRTERSLNPITNLPGNIAITDKLQQLAESTAPFAVIYTDIDNFKSYNDAYGFLQGDVVLRALGLILVHATRRWGNEHDFVGHVGGDDFILCTTPDKVDGICQEAIACFDAEMPKLYHADDRARGYVLGYSREGQPVEQPLITVSLAVVTNEHRPIESHWQIAELAAEVKRVAKQMNHSIYIKDLRSGRPTAEEGLLQRQVTTSSRPRVALITKDKTLRLVAPTILKRTCLDVLLCESIAQALEQTSGGIVVDWDILSDEDKARLKEASREGLKIVLLNCPAGETELWRTEGLDCQPKPYNLTLWAEFFKRECCRA
ncbi:MAG: response regulator [Firmicutes bacterium]|nr:response regulator [Dethiobacter sp.]MBS3887984.1 response regulator [Bacillota bacterium]